MGAPLPADLERDLPRSAWPELTLARLVQGRSVTGSVEGPDEDDVVFDGCRFSALRLIGGRLGHLALSDCALEACDLSGVDLAELRWDRVTVAQSRLAGCLTTGGFWRDVRLDDVRADRLEMRFATVRRARFTGCTFVGADLTGTVFDGVVLDGCDLSRARVDQLDARRVQFVGCDLSGVLGIDALRGATVDTATLATMGAAMATTLGISITAD